MIGTASSHLSITNILGVLPVTAQINDNFEYHGFEYSIIGISNGEIFDIALFGFQPTPVCSGCWRGYVAKYAIENCALILNNLSVTILADNEQRIIGPDINGVTPTGPNAEFDFLNNHYRGLNYKLDYSGELILGSEFIPELYDHMGFQQPWKYKSVVELSFENGLLISEVDVSVKIAKERTKIIKSGGYPICPTTGDEIKAWVEDAFDRSYGDEIFSTT